MRSEYNIRKYTPDDAECWNDFVRHSRQPLFLFDRGYMDYHSDRFTDCSLMVTDGHGRLVALLPAECDGETVASHRGLTYGGLITPERHVYGNHVMEIMEAVCGWFRDNGFRWLRYKPVPHIYTAVPAEEDLYVMFRMGAEVTGCHLSSALSLRAPRLINESTRQAISATRASGVRVSVSDDYATFWRMLEERLMERHGVMPVHTLDEMLLLVSRFPENIRLYPAGRDHAGAGAVVYLAGRTAHVQYIATTEEGRRERMLPLLLDTIAEVYTGDYDYLDFGASTTDSGRTLNEGLLMQKSGLGARGVVYPTYTITL